MCLQWLAIEHSLTDNCTRTTPPHRNQREIQWYSIRSSQNRQYIKWKLIKQQHTISAPGAKLIPLCVLCSLAARTWFSPAACCLRSDSPPWLIKKLYCKLYSLLCVHCQGPTCIPSPIQTNTSSATCVSKADLHCWQIKKWIFKIIKNVGCLGLRY